MQSKGREDSPLKELNEMEVSKLSDIEFKIMVIKMLKELTDNYKELSENSVSYTHLTLPTNTVTCRSRWSPYH